MDVRKRLLEGTLWSEVREAVVFLTEVSKEIDKRSLRVGGTTETIIMERENQRSGRANSSEMDNEERQFPNEQKEERRRFNDKDTTSTDDRESSKPNPLKKSRFAGRGGYRQGDDFPLL